MSDAQLAAHILLRLGAENQRLTAENTALRDENADLRDENVRLLKLREAAQEVTERWVNDRTALAGAIERLRAALGGHHE